MNNQECKVRPRIVNVNSEEPVFFPLSIKTSKFRGSCNNINNLYAKLCVLDVAKNLNIKEFNRMSETMKLMKQDIEWHESCKYKCRLDTNVCKCICECKEFIVRGGCDKGFIWNPSNCECECDKPLDDGECLDYGNCKGRKKLVVKLAEECTENVEEVKLAKITLVEDENKHKCSYTLYIVLLSIIFTVNIRLVLILFTTNT